jgi:hypothetical protein
MKTPSKVYDRKDQLLELALKLSTCLRTGHVFVFILMKLVVGLEL